MDERVVDSYWREFLKGNGMGLNLHTQPTYLTYDAGSVTQVKPNQNKDVETVPIENYEDSIYAVPLVGVRVMIDPERAGNYPSHLHGLSGTIQELNGGLEGVKDIIRYMKKSDKKYSGGWGVSVQFDNGESHSIRVRDMLQIANRHKTVYYVNLKDIGTNHLIGDEAYESYMNEMVIMKGYRVKDITKWDDEKRRKVFAES